MKLKMHEKEKHIDKNKAENPRKVKEGMEIDPNHKGRRQLTCSPNGSKKALHVLTIYSTHLSLY